MDVAGHLSARNLLDVQLNQITCGRTVGQRERTRFELAHTQVDVLTRLELHWFVQFDPNAFDGRREVLNALNHTGKVINRQVQRIGVFVNIRLDHHIGLERGAASQTFLLLTLVVHQGEIRGLTMIHLTIDDLHFAGGAQAVTAGMRQINTFAQSRVQYRLSFINVNGAADRFYG